MSDDSSSSEEVILSPRSLVLPAFPCGDGRCFQRPRAVPRHGRGVGVQSHPPTHQGDRDRPVGAMEAAPDAIVINTDRLSREDVIEHILKLASDRGLVSK